MSHSESERSQHPYDWNAKLVRLFLHNSRLVWLLLLAIIVGGMFALLSLRRESFPEVSPKVAFVQTVFPGATAEEMERQVTSVIEAAVKDVKGLKQTSSTSANSFSNVVVTLDESVDLDTAIQDVQAKVQSARNDLPPDIQTPEVQTFSTGGPAFIFGVTNTSGQLPLIRADTEAVMASLDNVVGVKSVQLVNPSTQRITVSFRPADLVPRGISVQTLQLVLQGANVNWPAGSLDLQGRSQSLVTIGSFQSLDEIRGLVIGVDPASGRPVRLSEVATIERDYDGGETINRFGYQRNGQLISQLGILVAIETTDTADVIRTRQAIDTQIADAKNDGDLAAGIDIISLSDEAKSTQEQIDEILTGAIGSRGNLWLLGGLQLLFLAMLLFVNWRAALVAALALPISLLFTMLCLWSLGIQLNTIVLFSLILVLGLIVDPAIVMVEAIQRFRDLKYSSNEAVLESGRRYGASLFMAVLTSLIVFVPFGVVSGIFGEIIKFIPLTIVPALVASYLVPIGFLPLFSKYLLRTHKPAHQNDGKAHEVAGLSSAAEWFMAVNRSILARRWKQIVTLIVGLVLVGASLSLVATGQVQTVQFSKPSDVQFVTIDARFQRAMVFADRDWTAKQLEAMVLTEAGVDHFMYFSQNRNGVYLWAELKPRSARGASDGSADIVERLRTKITDIPNLSDSIINEAGVGTPEPDWQISTQLYANNSAVLKRAAEDVGNFLRSQPNIIKVDDGFTGRREPELRLVLDRTKIQAAGLSSFEIGQQLKALIDETKVSKFIGGGGTADIYLQNASRPEDLAAIQQLPVATRDGQIIPLGTVATLVPASVVDAIERFDGQRFVNVRARVKGNNSDVFAVQRALNDYVTEEKLASLGIASNESRGEFDDIAKSFRELGMALVVAVLLTYIVLVLQFKSFSQPMIMLVTVPLSFIGVFPALWLTGSDLGFLELLGVTILVGIVENVAIFLMDYANQLVAEQGLTPREAIIQATGVRFRPILLTKLVALGGLLPLAIESEFWRGLAVTIMAGIGLSGFFSLVIIPILYVWIQAGRTRFHRKVSVAEVGSDLSHP